MLGRGINMVIMLELCYRQEVVPVILPLVYKDSDIDPVPDLHIPFVCLSVGTMQWKRLVSQTSFKP